MFTICFKNGCSTNLHVFCKLTAPEFQAEEQVAAEVKKQRASLNRDVEKESADVVKKCEGRGARCSDVQRSRGQGEVLRGEDEATQPSLRTLGVSA